MTDLGKTLELDEARRLASRVIAQAVEDATRYSSGELTTTLTHEVGRSAIAFLTSDDEENKRDRDWWCLVAGEDFQSHVLKEHILSAIRDGKVFRVSEYRHQPGTNKINRDIFDRTGLVDGLSLYDLLELEDEETDTEEGYTDEYE